MTGLFDRITLLKKPEVLDVDKLADETSVEVQEGAKEVNNDLQEHGVYDSEHISVPEKSSDTNFVDLGESDDIQFGGEKTPTDAILEMAGDDEAFAVKGVAPNPSGFSAAQIQADYHEELFGKDNIASRMLRDLCVWQSRYNSSGKKGERAKQVFGALGTAKQEEFQLEKETKGLLGK